MILTQTKLTYSKHSIIGLLLFLMLYIMGIWFEEYYNELDLKSSVSILRQEIYSDAYKFQAKVREHERLLKERETIHRRIEQVQQNREQRQDLEKPITRPLLSIDPTPSPPRVEDTNIPSKIQLLGILELELTENTSWHTLMKMMVTVLVTFFGIKLINLLFKRLELNIQS